MLNKFKVHIVLILILLISKEIFSYDSEKVVIFCILFFIILSYFNSREILYSTFTTQSKKMLEEYTNLIKSKEDYEVNIEKFWINFIALENQFIKTHRLIKTNLKIIAKKINNNRRLISFYIIKDQLNLLIKDKFKINQNLNIIKVKNSINSKKALFLIALNNNFVNKNDLIYYLNKLKTVGLKLNIISLLVNHVLNIQKTVIDFKNLNNYSNVIHITYSKKTS